MSDSFDCRNFWDLCPVLNQGKCNSCWAFCTSQCFTDRLRIHSHLLSDDYLNPLYFIQNPICSLDNFHLPPHLSLPDFCSMNCSGGFLEHCHFYLLFKGIPSVKKPDFNYKAKSIYKVIEPDWTDQEKKNAIKMEVSTFGPVSFGFETRQFGNVDGHAVSIIGWNEENWLCRNSQGENRSYFWKEMGDEQDVWGIEPFAIYKNSAF